MVCMLPVAHGLSHGAWHFSHETAGSSSAGRGGGSLLRGGAEAWRRYRAIRCGKDSGGGCWQYGPRRTANLKLPFRGDQGRPAVAECARHSGYVKSEGRLRRRLAHVPQLELSRSVGRFILALVRGRLHLPLWERTSCWRRTACLRRALAGSVRHKRRRAAPARAFHHSGPVLVPAGPHAFKHLFDGMGRLPCLRNQQRLGVCVHRALQERRHPDDL